ncbi:fumarylacetoacetate hydrolase family protein [Lentisphaera profundi]|uniref:Fumarylacetoacetate hydrolase family protein n=1 Tax=Lentisphaera profundi TaxID=1658616 RepID=A0ABY7VUH1_9BACT|nr:fumarylacetoacetate hydrolase family protein [Lentisphaera profundi]WDE97866.1 fumarylacetoacetate hydrolase family protein [Lentisphaera profundi]
MNKILTWIDNTPLPSSNNKIFCIGRNYKAHAHELGNELPQEPVIFMKGSNAISSLSPHFSLPENRGLIHHELEIALLIGETLKNASEEECRQAIIGIGLGLDLTLRELQNHLKSKQLPWERAKSFDGSAPISNFIPISQNTDLQNLYFSLKVNDEYRQQGWTGDMIFPCTKLLSFISQEFTVDAGDIILTGTPKGVSELKAKDTLECTIQGQQTHYSVVV